MFLYVLAQMARQSSHELGCGALHYDLGRAETQEKLILSQPNL